MTTAHVVPTWQLHHRLALSLEHAGITPEVMAAELGVHVNSVHNYASGRRRPKLAVLRVWADVCGVDRKWLTDGESGVSVTRPVTLGTPTRLRLSDLLTGAFGHPASSPQFAR